MLTQEAEDFLTKVERKFRDLLQASPNPEYEVQQAVNRLEERDLLGVRPAPGVSPAQAAFSLIGDNPNLSSIWRQVQSNGHWQAAETPEELISQLLPSLATHE